LGTNVTKVSGPDAHPFTNTIEYTLLSCGNININSNKFYMVELQEDPTTKRYRVFTNYGRIGGSSVYEERGPWHDEGSARHTYNEIVRQKQRGKSGGTSKYEIVEILCPTVGSLNIRSKVNQISVLPPRDLIEKVGSRYDPRVLRLLRQFA